MQCYIYVNSGYVVSSRFFDAIATIYYYETEQLAFCAPRTGYTKYILFGRDV